MFASRKPEPEASAPVEPAQPAPRNKVEPKDARAFQPSSFATRKAEADRANAERAKPRIASLGTSDYQQRTRHGDTEVIEVEQFFDIDHPAKRYVAMPGYRMAPTHDDQRREDVTDLPRSAASADCPARKGTGTRHRPTRPPRPVT